MEELRPLTGISAKMDDKGRLRLPGEILKYLGGIKDFYITRADRETARLYPISVWTANEKALAEAAEEDEAVADHWQMVKYYGKIEKLDEANRVTMKPNLRRDLGLEAQELMLFCSPGGIVDVISDAACQERIERALESRKAALGVLKRHGFR